MPIEFSNLFISFFITLSLIPILKGYALKMGYVDLPSPRKVHAWPIPKVGGLAMAIGAAAPFSFWAGDDPVLRSILIGSAIIVVFGAFDDIKNLGYRIKFFGQLAAAFIVVFFGDIRIESSGDLLPLSGSIPFWLSVPLTMFVIVGVTNAINLSDGLDGLAGGISVFSFICIGYLAFQQENMMAMALSLGMIGALFGFLRYNTHPALIFMGDAGSQLLGFLAVTLSVILTQGNTPVNRLFPLVILGLPVLDTLTVMVFRIIRGQSPFVADKTHFHHRLMKLGLTHREAVIVIYVLQALLVVLAFSFRFYSEWIMLAIFLFFSATTLGGFAYADRYRIVIPEYDPLQSFIRRKLKRLHEAGIILRCCFSSLAQGLPMLLIFSALLPSHVPIYFSILSAALAVLLILASVFGGKRVDLLLKWTVYLIVPLLIFTGTQAPEFWVNDLLKGGYEAGLAMMLIFSVIILKLTRRQKGFKATPTDYLIVLIAVVIPNLAGASLQGYDLSRITAKSLIFLFGYEVLIGEYRGNATALSLKTALSLILVSIKAMR